MFTDAELSKDAFLGGRIHLLQPKRGYRAGTDPVLLAASSKAKTGDTVLELGCGAGAALLCLNGRIDIKGVGLERNSEYSDLAQQNSDLNKADLKIYHSDLAEMPPVLRDQSFDHVMFNPPFFQSGKTAQDAGRAAARQEDTSLEIWIDHALRRLKPKGYLTLIHLSERLQDVISLINWRAGAIEIKPLAARNRRTPKRFILRARKGSSGGTTLCNPLILHEGQVHELDQDSYTPEAKAILRDAQPLEF
jgi:tRNA1(Val) A37 N6-methylase TrmN6